MIETIIAFGALIGLLLEFTRRDCRYYYRYGTLSRRRK